MEHKNHVCTGIKLGAEFDDINMWGATVGTDFDYFNTAEYQLGEQVLGVMNAYFDNDNGIFELSDLDKPKEYSKADLVELANLIAAENDIDLSFTESDIKVYIVPFYG